MKIGLLSAASSIHTVRIANALKAKGEDVVVISLPDHEDKEQLLNVKTIYLKTSGGKGYYLNAKEVCRIAEEEHLEVLNAHYASGYGTLGRLSGVHPLILSVWGSDVFSFPKQNPLNRGILKKNLKVAKLVYSTSQCMAEEIRKYVAKDKEIILTPFGVDTELFIPSENGNKDEGIFTFGFLKGSNPIYGVDLFLDAFEITYKWACENGIDITAEICGSSTEGDGMAEKIAVMAGKEAVRYVGQIPHEKMPELIRKCDAVCITSREESFGVVALEAMACGVPCITTDTPGLAEVMLDGSTGFVTEKKPELIAEKMIKMISEEELRSHFKACGRKHVEDNYDFDKNIDCFITGYRKVAGK